MTNEINELFTLAKEIAALAYKELIKINPGDVSKVSYVNGLPREMKASVDKIIEETIIENLLPTGLAILSEESGEFSGSYESSLKFVVDPLDGTVNFVRGLGPCSISIALCDNNQPIFGVLAIYPSGELAWGCIGKGAFLNEKRIHVSKITDPYQTVICTGFPSRYSFEDHESVENHIKFMRHFGKVRMLGAASNSLLQVAKGAAEVYLENEIMLWDVAAGLAIVKGAGGEYDIENGNAEHAVNIFACNGLVNMEMV